MRIILMTILPIMSLTNTDNNELNHLGARPRRHRVTPKKLKDYEVFTSIQNLEGNYLSLDENHRKQVRKAVKLHLEISENNCCNQQMLSCVNKFINKNKN